MATAHTENALTTIEPAAGTAIHFSTSALADTIPDWVNLAALASIVPHGYGLPIPAGAAADVRAAAALHHAALTPSTAEERQRLLMGLRSATIIRDEDADEAKATLNLLRVHLEDVPLDILETACRAYCNAPGRRFFPKSAGELRTFISPLLFARQAAVRRLQRLADEAERADARQAELDADPLTPEAAREILAELGISGRFAAMITPGGGAG